MATKPAPEFINREESLLVVVDVQEKLFNFIDNNEAMTTNIIKLINFAKEISLPVVYAEQIKLGSTISPIVEALKSYNPEIKPFEKAPFGCFGDESFVAALEKLNRKNLIVCGIETHVCVYQTVLGALQHNMRVQVVADAIGSRSSFDREIGLERIRLAGGELTSTESVIFELLERAGTDEFRQVLPLLK